MKTLYKPFLISVFCAAFFLPAHAQNIDVKWGEMAEGQATDVSSLPKSGSKYTFAGETMYGKSYPGFDFRVTFTVEGMNTSSPWHLYSIGGGGRTVPINDDGFRIVNIQVARDTNNNFLCIGIYSLGWESRESGLFKMVVDPRTGKALSKELWPFNEEFLSHFMSESQAKKGKPLHEYKIKGVAAREDGGFTIIAEYGLLDGVHVANSLPPGMNAEDEGAYKNRGTVFYNSAHQVKTDAIYKDVFVVNMKPGFTMDWVAVVPKDQHVLIDAPVMLHSRYTSEEYLSTSWFCHAGKVYLFYNDKRGNIAVSDRDKLQTLTNMDNTEAVVAEIDAKGNVSKKTLFSNHNLKEGFVPLSCTETNSKTIEYLMNTGKGYQKGTFTFKE